VTNITEIKRERTNQEVLKTLKVATKAIEEAEYASSFMLMVKVDNQYLRFSSELTDVMELISQLELMKHDLFQRMSNTAEDIDGGQPTET
tara:strand:+ start:907 stop:1176 length:270 start_codon:yes stop_codon:yes gene_type:complete